MKVDVIGKGVIPGLGILAPVKGIDASREEVKRIIIFKTFKVYGENCGLITKNNIDKVFDEEKIRGMNSYMGIKNDDKIPTTVEEVAEAVMTFTETLESSGTGEKMEEIPVEVSPSVDPETTPDEEVVETPTEAVETTNEDVVEEEVKTNSNNNNGQYHSNNKKKNKKH